MITVESPVITPIEEVLGIDLGLAHLAVTSANQFLGKKAEKATEGRYFRLKRRLQQRGEKTNQNTPEDS